MYRSHYKGEEVEYILDNSILKKKQVLTEEEKNQVKENLGIEKVDLSGYVTEKELNNAITNIPEEDYESDIEDKTLSMPNAVGGIKAGTKVSDLEGMTHSEILDAMLFPTINPTFIEPSATIKLSNYNRLQEVGSNAPTASNFATSYNGGAILLNGVKKGDRAGEMTSDEVYSLDGDMPRVIPLGNTRYVYRVNYAEGEQPKDNKGNDYGSPLPSGYVESAPISVNGTYPWYIRTIKQPLVEWGESMNTGNFTLAATGVAEQIIKLPKTLTEMKMLNTISNRMEVVSTSDWKHSTEIINGITYHVYSYAGEERGEVTLSVTF